MCQDTYQSVNGDVILLAVSEQILSEKDRMPLSRTTPRGYVSA